MKSIIRKLARRKKIYLVIYAVTLIAYLVTFILFTRSLLSLEGVETLFRYIGIALLFGSAVHYFIMSASRIVKRKYKRFIVSAVMITISSIFLGVGSFYIDAIYEGISGFGERDEVEYTSYLVTLTDGNLTEDSKIGMITNTSDIEGYTLAKKLMTEESLTNEIVKYDSYIMMLDDLYSGEIDGAFMQSNYVSLLGSEEGFENIAADTIVLYSYKEKMENTDKTIVATKDFDEPLTFLIMGVDSAEDGLDANAAFNGDTLMLITFNPTTLNATMFSMPRDILVPITCNNNSVSKINSSAAYGTECVIETVEKLTDVDVDYYIKINFKGVVELVDALGGVNVNVEEPDYDTYDGQVCEQNSDRYTGVHLICMDTGYQTLNGEQALAYARNRNLYMLSDIDRNRHQQEVVTAIANKVTTLNSFSDFEKVLNTVSDNIITNMSPEQMLSGYEVMKDALLNSLAGEELINIEKSYLEYYNLRVYLPSSGREAESLGYYQDSLDNIIKMMKINLELETHENIKTFSFSGNEVYETTIAGSGYTKDRTYEVMPSFIGLSKSKAQDFCNDYNLSCDFITVDSTQDEYNSSVDSNLIGDQSIHINQLIGTFKSIDFYINGEIIEEEPEEDEEEDQKPTDDEVDPNVNDMVTE